MYIIPDMIEMGLKEGESFKSKFHKKVAQILVIGVPGIDDLDTLIHIVQTVNSVPTERIKTITLDQLRKEFDLIYTY